MRKLERPSDIYYEIEWKISNGQTKPKYAQISSRMLVCSNGCNYLRTNIEKGDMSENMDLLKITYLI